MKDSVKVISFEQGDQVAVKKGISAQLCGRQIPVVQCLSFCQYKGQQKKVHRGQCAILLCRTLLFAKRYVLVLNGHCRKHSSYDSPDTNGTTLIIPKLCITMRNRCTGIIVDDVTDSRQTHFMYHTCRFIHKNLWSPCAVPVSQPPPNFATAEAFMTQVRKYTPSKV